MDSSTVIAIFDSISIAAFVLPGNMHFRNIHETQTEALNGIYNDDIDDKFDSNVKEYPTQ